MPSADLVDLRKKLEQLKEEREKLHLRLKTLRWDVADIRIPKPGSGQKALASLLHLFTVFQRLDKKELGLLASKSSAREALCNELTVVKQAFARSDEVLQIDRRRIDTLAKKSTQAFEIGKDLAECTEHVLEQIKNKEAINSARIEEAKRKAHLCLLETNELASHQEENSALLERIEKKRDIGRIVHNSTKYVPGTNIVTFPVTRMIKSHYNRRSTSLQDEINVAANQQKELGCTIAELQSDIEKLSLLSGDITTLQEDISVLSDQGEELQSASKRLLSDSMGWLDMTRGLSIYLEEVNVSIDELSRLTELGDYRRARGRVVEALRCLLQSLDGVTDGRVLEIYDISDDKLEALRSVVQRYERPVKWYQRGHQSLQGSKSQPGEEWEL